MVAEGQFLNKRLGFHVKSSFSSTRLLFLLITLYFREKMTEF